ncbi:hypothetical protein P7H74_09510 [Enterococcus devriesei]|uniref:hypothetical protein n=1 Tax=Enterococcus devriesei TaxID=319970 RepID=UPI001C0FE371|nr:hypothetical protein [Enterococcus devriesei]MBU5365841.1 hypothetical protein [Enterococcus devriesei]MDT2821992.1 hypothetical protein [Enterococcus devriesei]
MLENQQFQLSVAEDGHLSQLFFKNDPYGMNWVIEEEYLNKVGYNDIEKLFGQFDLVVNGTKFLSTQTKPEITEIHDQIKVHYPFNNVSVNIKYRLKEQLNWEIELSNESDQILQIDDFGVWASLSYIMFRDKNVLRNIHDSAAVFSSISTDYTKLNAVRRDNLGGNLGIYQTKGQTLSIGTYCAYENLFFENVSPSLDGLLFHKLILANGYPSNFENRDWIYSKKTFELPAKETRAWHYTLARNENQADFYQKALQFNHPKIDYTPLNILGKPARITVQLPNHLAIEQVLIQVKDNQVKDNQINSYVADFQVDAAGKTIIHFKPEVLGEHKVIISFTNGTEDFVVMNVMNDLSTVIEERADYICETLYNGATGATPYAFEPVSNQGESLGKLNLVLKKNLLGKLDPEQVRKVEESAVHYVKAKWFIDGDFLKPRKLYGDFYRCMDFEYIGHLFYLLSEFEAGVLQLHSAETYLTWAADVFDLRVNPALHEDERGKEEAQMLGVYFLYIQELLQKLKAHGLMEKYETIRGLWNQVTQRVDSETFSYKAAITEHFYDNAGFGPTAGALSESGLTDSAEKYGELLLANIGYSNDFRGQNADRWWEALTYMIHSLWGGVTAAATFKVFEALQDPAYLEASYRATAGILYCYDTHSSTTLPLEKGMAASTYAVAGPHLNRPDLSRERFGQATFWRDGGIFSRLFENDSQTPDWDMGEELVAYMESFGQKTFIIKESATIRVINGSFEESEEGYTIFSFAPFNQAYYLIDGKQTKVVETNELTLQLRKDALFPLESASV